MNKTLVLSTIVSLDEPTSKEITVTSNPFYGRYGERVVAYGKHYIVVGKKNTNYSIEENTFERVVYVVSEENYTPVEEHPVIGRYRRGDKTIDVIPRNVPTDGMYMSAIQRAMNNQ